MKKCFIAIMLLISVHSSAKKFQHIIIIVQENRTPDNLFGFNPTFKPGVDLATYAIGLGGQTIPLMPLPWVSCYDLWHGYYNFVKDYAGGQMNGWDIAKPKAKPGCDPGPHPSYSLCR